MIILDQISKETFETIPDDPFWNTGDANELKMHRIHSYPAKFPAFLTTKALEFAEQYQLNTSIVADVFCGCGTVAFEAKRSNIDFWGCDINPVATMIAKTKSHKYQTWRLRQYYNMILDNYAKRKQPAVPFVRANERLKYWYEPKNYADLSKLKKAITESTPKSSHYRLFFICAFSNILKASSRWLTKSIKPQIDPSKKIVDVLTVFCEQCEFMMSANKQSDILRTSNTKIITGSILEKTIKTPQVDMIITSPPYVTSYEYADLHQLSAIWLGFAEDYRDLRDGSIGSCHHAYNFEREVKRLNDTGSQIVFRLLDQYKSKARAVAKYFLDMQQVAEKTHSMLHEKGLALFVIGNTEYKGVRIDNALHLAESLRDCGFKEILVSKRKISKKILTPYRDKRGCFTTDRDGRKVYSEEYILVGRK